MLGNVLRVGLDHALGNILLRMLLVWPGAVIRGEAGIV